MYKKNNLWLKLCTPPKARTKIELVFEEKFEHTRIAQLSDFIQTYPITEELFRQFLE